MIDRMAKCGYCHNTRPSQEGHDGKLAFFQDRSKPENVYILTRNGAVATGEVRVHKDDVYYCGCRGWE